MRKQFLEKRAARLTKKIEEYRARAKASEDVNEVRSLTAQIEDLTEDLNEVREELDLIAAEEAAPVATPPEARAAVPAGAQLVNGGIVGTFPTPEQRTETPWNGTMEYRRAFMNYVQNGTTIPAELIPAEVRAGDTTSTKETGAAIPITVMNEVINTVRKRYGNLYNKVRKLNIQGGVKFPVGALSATFRWVNEKTVSPRQKAGNLGDVSFFYNVAEIRISQTFLSAIVTLESFEATIAEEIAIAFLQAMDEGIVAGSGDNSMLGIINDPRVTNVIEMSAADMSDWTKWRKNFFSKIPMGYRAGEFIFPLSTIESYLETMADSNNNPIFRQATGLEMASADNELPNGRFFGREVNPVEPDILPDFDAAEVGDVVGIFYQPRDYAINENFAFTMRRYFDEEENEIVNKALVVTDGKTLNPTGFYLIKKKA